MLLCAGLTTGCTLRHVFEEHVKPHSTKARTLSKNAIFPKFIKVDDRVAQWNDKGYADEVLAAHHHHGGCLTLANLLGLLGSNSFEAASVEYFVNGNISSNKCAPSP